MGHLTLIFFFIHTSPEHCFVPKPADLQSIKRLSVSTLHTKEMSYVILSIHDYTRV